MKISQSHNVTKKGVVRRNPPKKADPNALFKAPLWTEQTVKLALRRVNDGRMKPSAFFDMNKLLYEGEGVALTPEHNRKGFEFLMDKWKTASGDERKNNPFRGREQAVLESFSEIRFRDFYSENGRYYYPLYEVIGTEGSFEYYYNGEIQIVG